MVLSIISITTTKIHLIEIEFIKFEKRSFLEQPLMHLPILSWHGGSLAKLLHMTSRRSPLQEDPYFPVLRLLQSDLKKPVSL